MAGVSASDAWLATVRSDARAAHSQRHGSREVRAGRDYTQASPIEGSFVSKGTGWLDVVIAQVTPSLESMSFDDAMSLIENAKSA